MRAIVDVANGTVKEPGLKEQMAALADRTYNHNEVKITLTIEELVKIAAKSLYDQTPWMDGYETVRHSIDGTGKVCEITYSLEEV